MPNEVVRYSLQQIRQRKSVTNRQKLAATIDDDIARQIVADPDLYELTNKELAEFDLEVVKTFPPLKSK
ncbi:hypothetical protein [Arsukibacterium sp.]|uniref:hypothetical protein n=1 Tax=Arsukibacterium sp. TaxID=1977258 RepID=UPI001BD5CAF3|nr:hypothetical protein [Arsukibacterium sp.]